MERLPSPQEPPIARSYLEVLRRYKWLLVTTSLAGAIVAAISSFRALPVYRASAKLLIERAAPQVLKVPEVLPTDWHEGFRKGTAQRHTRVRPPQLSSQRWVAVTPLQLNTDCP